MRSSCNGIGLNAFDVPANLDYIDTKTENLSMRTVHVVTAVALLVAASLPGALPDAWAQPGAPDAPASAASAPPPPPPPMINRWVDAHGRVHYGDALPPDAPEQTTQVGPIQTGTPEQKADADAQMQKYRDYLDQPAATPQQAASQPGRPAPQDDSCAGQWARYNAAAACASQYHVVGGGLKQSFAANCPNLPQPQCAPPSP
jgi:hypothetical protein